MSERSSERGDGSAGTSDTAQQGSTILPGFIGRSFLAKFIASLFLVLLLVGGVSAYTFNQTSAEVTDTIRTEYVGVAEQSAQQIENWRTSRADTTRRLSEFGVMQNGDQEAIQSFLISEADRLPDDVYRLHYVNLDTSTIVASSNPANVDQTLNSREAPWQVEDYSYGPDGVFVSDAKEAHGQSEVDFVSPVNREGNMALVVQTNFDQVASGLSTVESGVFSQIVDGNGKIVAGTRQDDQLDRNDGVLEDFPGGVDAPVIRNALEGGSGFLSDGVQYQDLSESHVRAYAPVGEGELVVVTHVPESTAFALRSTITNSLLILVATVLLGFAFLAITFGRGTVVALNRLTEKARELEQGNLDVDLSVSRADEFGELTASFANMRDSLREQIEQANRARKQAETARVEAEEMNEYLQEKAQTYSDIMQQCAAGDMTQRMETDGRNDSMDQIAEEFNEMISELEKTTGQLQTFSDEVIESSDFVMTSADSVREASEQVAESAQTISAESHEQRDRLRDVADQLDELVATFEAVDEENPDVDIGDQLDQFRELQDALETAVETSDGLPPETENVAGAAEEQAAELNQVSSRADRLKRYAQPLGEIVNKFETDDEHEFVFSQGPTPSVEDDD